MTNIQRLNGFKWFASKCGCEFVDFGNNGHINFAAGFCEWIESEKII
jgi:predicted alpha/beta hydrolase family esterase